jgi:3D (Asp-Asp-Asp) domain-containing protein
VSLSLADYPGRDIVGHMTTTIPVNTISKYLRRLALPVVAGAVAISSIAAAMPKAEQLAVKPIQSPALLVSVVNVPTPKQTAKQPAAELMHDAAAALPPAHMPSVRIVMMEVTAYCPCPKCCGPKAAGITASGKDIGYNAGRFVAADSRLAFGTQLVIPGYDAKPVEVIDRGGAIKGNKIDVFFPTHAEALKWGRRHIQVTVID